MVLPSRTQLQSWMDAITRTLFKLVLADIVCSFVAEWLFYWFSARKRIGKPKQGGGHGLQVIISGFSRTGTSTLQSAMDILGFPCFHGRNLSNPITSTRLMKAYRSGKKEDWDRVVEGYTCIADFPAARCYKELLKLYPNAKVIMNVRDPQRWYKSHSESFRVAHGHKIWQFIRPFKVGVCVKEMWEEGMLKGEAMDKKSLIQLYNNHIEEVKAHVQPPSNLLVYEIGDNTKGWAPLCEFLGVDIPQVPFPFSNDSKAFQNLMSYRNTIVHLVVACYFALIVLLVSFLAIHLYKPPSS